MKLTTIAAALAVSVAASHAFAAEVDVRSRFATQNYVRESKPTPKALTPTLACPLPAQLPAGPPTGAVSASFNGAWSESDDAFIATLWREPCPSDASHTTLYFRVTPTKGVPFICSSAVTVIVNNNQYDGKLVQTSSGSSFCGDLFVATTFAMDQWSFNPQYDRNLALTVIFAGVDNYYQGSLPAYSGSGTSDVVRFPAQVPVGKWPAAEDVYAAIIAGDWALAKQRYDAKPQDVSDAIGAVQYWYLHRP